MAKRLIPAVYSDNLAGVGARTSTVYDRKADVSAGRGI